PGKVIQPARQPGEIPHTIAVRIGKGLHIETVQDGILVPLVTVSHGLLLQRSPGLRQHSVLLTVPVARSVPVIRGMPITPPETSPARPTESGSSRTYAATRIRI